MTNRQDRVKGRHRPLSSRILPVRHVRPPNRQILDLSSYFYEADQRTRQ